MDVPTPPSTPRTMERRNAIYKINESRNRALSGEVETYDSVDDVLKAFEASFSEDDNDRLLRGPASGFHHHLYLISAQIK